MHEIYKVNYIKRQLYFFLTIACFAIIIGCKSDKNHKSIKDNPTPLDSLTVVAHDTHKLKKVQFYLENSLSMNGYLEGENFKRNIRRFTRKKDNYTVDSYFANLKIIKENNIWERVNKKNIREGSVNSDTGFILKEAIQNQSDSIISIVITEGIYSSDIGSDTTLDIDIEDDVENLISNKNFDTVIIKCISYFDGAYYVEDKNCKTTVVSLKQKRPYYVFIFGTPELINNFLKDGVSIEDLDGYENSLRFNSQKEEKITYTFLSKGSERKGRFKSNSKYFEIVHEIVDAEAKPSSSSDEFQFAVALDYSTLKSLSNQFLKDKKNYTIDSKYPYEIIEINSINNISSQAKSQLKRYEEKGNNFTHFMVLKAKKSAISGEITITLKKEIPKWASNVGLDSDCVQMIKGNTEQTYTLDKVIKGLSKAYNYNAIEDYFSIYLTIKI